MATTGEKEKPAGRIPQPEAAVANSNGDESIDQVPMFRKRRVIIPLALILAAALAGGWYWYVNLRGYVTSDDAYIDADRVSISSKMLGRIQTLTVDEGDTVAAGQVIVTLDDSDLRAQLAQATAAFRLAGAELGLLIDRVKRQVHVYRRSRKAKHQPQHASDADVEKRTTRLGLPRRLRPGKVEVDSEAI